MELSKMIKVSDPTHTDKSSGWSVVVLGEYSTRANSGLHEGLLAGNETGQK
jgi:hypothetical protein